MACQAVLARSAEQFARLAVTAVDGYQFEVDRGVDWRAHDPVQLEVGPVLALEDAVANKIGALALALLGIALHPGNGVQREAIVSPIPLLDRRIRLQAGRIHLVQIPLCALTNPGPDLGSCDSRE